MVEILIGGSMLKSNGERREIESMTEFEKEVMKNRVLNIFQALEDSLKSYKSLLDTLPDHVTCDRADELDKVGKILIKFSEKLLADVRNIE